MEKCGWEPPAPLLCYALLLQPGAEIMGDSRRFLPQLLRGALSLIFLFIVAVATAGFFSLLFIAILLSAGLAIAAIQALFPASRLFSIAFANLIAVYAAIFSLFVEDVFNEVDSALLSIGFCLPILAFVAGCWFRRDQVRAPIQQSAAGDVCWARSSGFFQPLSSRAR
jgi:hypothetical protein